MTNYSALGFWLVFALGCSSDSGGSGSGGTAGGGTAGATGGTAGASGGTAGGAGSGGLAAACAELQLEFLSTLTQAKACSLDSTSPTCVQAVDSSIDGCGYFVFAEGSNLSELQELENLKQEWKVLDCESGGSCALGGFTAKPATCKSNGMGGATAPAALCTEN